MLIFSFIVTLVSALILVPLVRMFAIQRGLVDEPDGNRKKHVGPIPNIGGVAIALSVGIGLLFPIIFGNNYTFEITSSKIIVMIGALIVIATGVYDDIYHLGFKKKFLVQVFVAYLLLHAGYRVELGNLLFMFSDPYQQALYSIPITMVWIVGILNAVNLLDGMDGLAAGVTTITFASLAVLFGIQGDMHLVALSVVIIAALLGFLRYNFSPASIFMGDTGSLFLGYTLATCTLALEGGAHENPVLALLIPVIPLGLPILDTGLSIVRRMRANKSPFMPDDDHIHHRLGRLYSRPYAVIILYGVALWFGGLAILMTLVENPPFGFAIAGITCISVYLGMRALGYTEAFRSKKKQEEGISTEAEQALQSEKNGLIESGDGSSVPIEEQKGDSEELSKDQGRQEKKVNKLEPQAINS